MRRLSRIRFSLAAMLMGVVPIATAALVAARWEHRIRSEGAVRELLEGAGVVVGLAPLSAIGNDADRPPDWFLALIGESEWRPVWSVFFPLGSEATNELIQATASFRDLRSLSAIPCSADDSAFECLGSFPRLESLSIRSKNITGDCLRMIVSTKLRTLNLCDCPIDDAAIVQMDTHLPIKSLDLSNTKISDVGLAHVVKLAALRELKAARTAIIGTGLQDANCQRASIVDLSYTGLDDAIVPLLRQLPLISICRLNGTAITNTGLVKLSRLPKLTLVEARDTRVTSDGTKLLFEARPDVLVFWDHTMLYGRDTLEPIRKGWN